MTGSPEKNGLGLALYFCCGKMTLSSCFTVPTNTKLHNKHIYRYLHIHNESKKYAKIRN